MDLDPSTRMIRDISQSIQNLMCQVREAKAEMPEMCYYNNEANPRWIHKRSYDGVRNLKRIIFQVLEASVQASP